MNEQTRIDFLVARGDSPEQIRAFIDRTYYQYRTWAYGKNRIQNSQFRKPIVAALIELRKMRRRP
jgi:hypothetical protein